jgi:hypothetical protein
MAAIPRNIAKYHLGNQCGEDALMLRGGKECGESGMVACVHGLTGYEQ